MARLGPAVRFYEGFACAHHESHEMTWDGHRTAAVSAVAATGRGADREVHLTVLGSNAAIAFAVQATLVRAGGDGDPAAVSVVTVWSETCDADGHSRIADPYAFVPLRIVVWDALGVDLRRPLPPCRNAPVHVPPAFALSCDDADGYLVSAVVDSRRRRAAARTIAAWAARCVGRLGARRRAECARAARVARKRLYSDLAALSL